MTTMVRGGLVLSAMVAAVYVSACEKKAPAPSEDQTKPTTTSTENVPRVAPALATTPGPKTNARGTSSGPTANPGFDHPNQYIHLKAQKPAANMYPVISHPKQEQQARDKLAALEQKTGKKPNILVFLLDDVGWMDPGYNGGGVAVGNDTPVMDKLAHEGLILTSAYSTPSCSPTRATIHTGQNPLHHGLLRPPMYGEAGGLDGSFTLPMALKKLGYRTQGVGKWHMGENKGSLPQNVGYDDYRGFLGVSDMYTEWRDEYFNPEVALSPARYDMMLKDPFNHNDVHCSTDDKEKCDNVKEIDLAYTKELDAEWLKYSQDFITRMKDQKEPFFLYHATRGCHFDNYPSPEWAGRSAARTVYSDCMVHMDHVLSELVRTLSETGQLENTLIFVTSDNGPECEVPPHGRTPFRGCKGSSWEGGVRVPTFAYWKGHDCAAQIGWHLRPRGSLQYGHFTCWKAASGSGELRAEHSLHRWHRPSRLLVG